MKEKDPQHTLNNRRNNKVATRCRICGGKLYTPQNMKIEMQKIDKERRAGKKFTRKQLIARLECNKDNTNIYMM